MDSTSKCLLYMISILDNYGALEWNLRAVAATSAVLFFTIRTQMKKSYGIDWDSFIHSIIVGLGSLFCVYLNANAAFHLSGFPEPIGSLQECGGPLTSLHRIIPAITQGYALCDIINGFHLISTGLGPEHLAHGVATFAVTTVFNELKASHVLTPYLIMEMSTIILGIVKADFLSPNMRIATQFLFVLVFFVCRLVVFPLHYFSTISLYRYGCFTPFLFYVSLLFGAFFNLLNVFWFIKMLKKIHRKFSGAESFLNADKD